MSLRCVSRQVLSCRKGAQVIRLPSEAPSTSWFHIAVYPAKPVCSSGEETTMEFCAYRASTEVLRGVTRDRAWVVRSRVNLGSTE